VRQSSVRNVFIRGSVVRYVHLSAASVDTALLEDATRRGESPCGSAGRARELNAASRGYPGGSQGTSSLRLFDSMVSRLVTEAL